MFQTFRIPEASTWSFVGFINDPLSWIREESLVLQQQRWVFPHYPFLFGFPFQLVIKGTCQQTLPTQDPRRNNFATKMSPKNPHGTSPSQCGPLPHPVWYTVHPLPSRNWSWNWRHHQITRIFALRLFAIEGIKHQLRHTSIKMKWHISRYFYKSYLRYVYS